MLENDRPATAEVVKHIDRCLSCLACMTTCPSGVHYMHLVDHARAHIEETYRAAVARPGDARAAGAACCRIRGRFRAALAAGWFAGAAGQAGGLVARTRAGAQGRARRARLAAASRAGGRDARPAARRGCRTARPTSGPACSRPQGARKGRVALLHGCAQAVLAPSINEAAIRLLTRQGVEVVLAAGEGCCGALVHHMGREHQALAQARANIDAWTREIENGGLDAIMITASGCGTTIKDYGFMLRNDPAYAEKAARVSALAKDISEYLAALDLGAPARRRACTVAYHSACSLQHGQKIMRQPKDLLAKLRLRGARARPRRICAAARPAPTTSCSPRSPRALRDRKVANIERTGADVIATGNIGCMTQIAPATRIPIVHTVELLDWAHGGPLPEALRPTLV